MLMCLRRGNSIESLPDFYPKFTLFIKNYDGTSIYKQIGFLWLDHALGEYDVETKLAQIDFKALGSDQARQLKPLRQLPLTVDMLRSQK